MASNPPPLPIVVNPSSVQAAILAATRILIILSSGFATLVPLVGKVDIAGIQAFFAGNDGLVFLGAAIAIGTFGYSIYITITKHRRLVIAASAAPNSVAVVKTPSSGALCAPIAIVGALVLALLVSGCATVGNPETSAQKLYAALGTYDAALTGATVYAASPTADKAIVRRLDQVNQAAIPAVAFARAYPICKSGAKMYGATPCVTFNFTPAGILSDVIALQGAIASLQMR